MPGAAAAHVPRRRHQREHALLRRHLPGAGEARRLLLARRALRSALVQRVVRAGHYGKLVFLAYFNAGVRAVDVRDPFRPREAGYFLPATTPTTDTRCVDV